MIKNMLNHDNNSSYVPAPAQPLVKLRYFASLRDTTGKAEEWIPLSVPTAGELFTILQKTYGFSLAAEDVRVAINGKFSEHEYALKHNDEVVFIPPVSGG